MDIKELILRINDGKSISKRYKEKHKLNEKYSFYEFIEDELNNYEKQLKAINRDELSRLLIEADWFRGEPTAQRFYNLIKNINKEVLKTLDYCYRGDLLNAIDNLISLLGYKNKKIKLYLVEEYINHFNFKLGNESTYFRVRDFEKGDEIDNCYHVPYNLRGIADNGRYSISGFPCLYIADNLKAACKEVGNKPEGKFRYYAEYKAKGTISLLDLSLKSKEEIDTLDAFDIFRQLVTYPLKLTCIIKTRNENQKNYEEYFIPQLISHCFLYGQTEQVFTNYEGIAYTSTHDFTSICAALPAKFKPKDKINFEGYCDWLLSKFTISDPIKYIE